ncbi:DUF982 domain-containing protein [Devosia sp. CN2-171]|uniref:DUF982 domain-containing protein n=1 Tax=Devosia sp. CN2-171 TaxID=3400909 RepID=UPI003BF7E87D
MGHTPFSNPVFLRLHRTGTFQARNAWEACEYLDLHWPAARTAHYRQAKALCQSAIDGVIDAEIARRAVIDAAQRAGVLATKWETDGERTNTTNIPANAAWPISAPAHAAPAEADDEVTDSDFVGYFRATDILNDPALSPSRKRALLAHWASDINAVVGVPGLRCVRGVTVSIDSILEALRELDLEVDQAAMVAGSSGAGDRW